MLSLMKDTGRVRITIVTLMVSLSIVSYFDRTIMSVAGPRIMREFAISETRIGVVYSAFILSYLILMIPGGRLADRFGPRKVLAWTGLGAAFFTALTALGGRPGLGVYLGVVPSFVMVRFALGAMNAPLYPSCATMTSHWMPLKQHALIIGLITAGAGLGGALSPVLFSWMINFYGWRVSFCLAGVITGFLALCWFYYVRDYPDEHSSIRNREPFMRRRHIHTSTPTTTPWGTLLTDRNLVLLTFSYATLGYFQCMFIYWTYYYYGAIRHMGSKQTAVYTTISFLTYTVMAPVGGWCSDYLSKLYGVSVGRRFVCIVSLSLGALLLYMGTRLTGNVSTVVFMSLAVGFSSCSEAPFWASTIHIAGKHVGAACGILNTGANVGALIAPVVTPYIASRAGWSLGLHAGSLIVMFGVVAWFFVNPSRQIATEHVTHESLPSSERDGASDDAEASSLSVE